MPELGTLMIMTKSLNDYLGTTYTLEQVSEMEEAVLIVDVLNALRRGLNPPKVSSEHAKKSR